MSGGGSFSSDQTTLQKDTGAISLLRAGRARITSIQGRGEAGSVLLLQSLSQVALMPLVLLINFLLMAQLVLF